MLEIVQKGDPVLRKKSKKISIKDITSSRIQNIISEMHLAVKTQIDGVALAGPQIGYSLRIFVIAPRAYDINISNKKYKPLVFINPKIIKKSKEKKWTEEGCLSVRPWYGKTHRSIKATVEAYNENGEKFTYGGSNLIAQIFQHEIDHLDGILFSDHAKELKEYYPQEISKEKQQND